MKKIFAVILPLIITAVIFMTACADKPSDSKDIQTEESNLSGETLNIGILPAESAIPIIIAYEMGYFEEAGLDVSIKAFSSPNDRNVAVQAKELDGAIGDVMTCAAFVDNGIAMKITSDISEDFKILSSPNSGVAEMSGLADKKVSLVKNFILEYIMDQFAKEGGFAYEIVEIPSFSGRTEALMSDQVDAVLFTEPQAGMLVQQGAHLLGSSKDAGIKGGTLMFTDEAINERSGDIDAFYKAYNIALDYMNSAEVEEYSDILAQYQFPDAIAGYLSGMYGTFRHAGIIPQDQFESIIAWTLEKGLITKSYAYDELTDFSFIK